MAGFFKMLAEHHKKNKARSKNFELFKACMAGAALAAMADGEFARREQAALKKLIGIVDELKLYGAAHTREVFMEFVENIKNDPDQGREQALQAVAVAKDDPEWAATAIMLAATISESDGTIDQAEVEVVERLGELLGIDPLTVETLKIDFKDEIFK